MFSKFELTNKGVELLNRVIAEQETLKFTKFQLGKGDFSGDKKTLTQLVSKIDEFNVSQTNVLADGITNIKGFYDNRNLSIAIKLTEIGIMAQLGDNSLTEVLFSYSNQPSAEAETIPAKESYFSRTFSVMNRTDNVTSVTFDLTIRQDKYNFGTLAEMKAADYLDVGDKVTLWGNAALGDSSFKMYIITDQAQEIQLNNLLYAKEYFKIINDLTTGGTDKAGSAEMVKKLNENKVNKSGDKMTGSLEMGDGKTFIGAHNYGYTLRNKLGNQEYLGYVDTSGKKGNLIIAGSNVDGVIIRNNTTVNGALSSTGNINVGNNIYVKTDAMINKYLRIRDYYGIEDYARFWYNSNQQSEYTPKTLYIDDAQNLFVNRRKVLTEANSGFVKEKLFDGTLTRTQVALPKYLTEFDIIIIESGDSGLNTAISAGGKRGDMFPNWYLPSQIIGNRIQVMHYDSDGTNSSDSDLDCKYLDIVDSKTIKFIYDYTIKVGYQPSAENCEIRIFGIKYIFGGK